MAMSKEEIEIITALFDTGCLKFGKFKLRSGIEAPYYIDFRKAPLFRQLFEPLCKLAVDRFFGSQEDQDNVVIAGVPYGAMPLACCISDRANIPYLALRKERKSYGNNESFAKDIDSQIIIIDDVISSGQSIQEIIDTLKQDGLSIKAAIVIVERQQNGVECLRDRNKNISFKHLFTITEILTVLEASGRVTKDIRKETLDWIRNNKMSSTIDNGNQTLL